MFSKIPKSKNNSSIVLQGHDRLCEVSEKYRGKMTSVSECLKQVVMGNLLLKQCPALAFSFMQETDKSKDRMCSESQVNEIDLCLSASPFMRAVFCISHAAL